MCNECFTDDLEMFTLTDVAETKYITMCTVMYKKFVWKTNNNLRGDVSHLTHFEAVMYPETNCEWFDFDTILSVDLKWSGVEVITVVEKTLQTIGIALFWETDWLHENCWFLVIAVWFNRDVSATKPIDFIDYSEIG